jgi:hypothetical protein
MAADSVSNEKLAHYRGLKRVHRKMNTSRTPLTDEEKREKLRKKDAMMKLESDLRKRGIIQ